MEKFIFICLFLTVGCLVAGCYDCGPRAEPTISLGVNFPTTDSLLRVSALGIKSDSAFRDFSIRDFNGGGQVPLSLLQDSTTYLFYFTDRTDTLTLFYERIFDARQECGYYVDIAAPKGRRYRSTFRDVQTFYDSYLGEIKGIGHRTAFGISVRVSR